MMRRLMDIRLCWVALLVLLMAGCGEEGNSVVVDESVVMKNASSIVVYINLPDNNATTRNDDDYVINPDRSYEQAINSLRVWVFAREDNQNKTLKPIADTDAEDVSNGVLYKSFGADEIRRYSGIMEVAFKVEAGFSDTYKCLDVYVIANAESLGSDYGTDWGEPTNEGLVTNEQRLEAIALGENCFGVGSNMVYESNGSGSLVPTEMTARGLPMSGYVKKAAVTTEDIIYKIQDIQLKRAVSKIRFVFAKSPTTKDAQIKGVKLAANMIPTTEWLFTGTAATSNEELHIPSYGSNYYGEIDFGAPAEIKTNVMPSTLEWSTTVNRQQWEQKLNEAIANGDATEFVRAYLHESPSQLQGSITYNLNKGENPQDKTIPFAMAHAGEFERNYSWTIYAYFTEGGLVFEVANWEDVEVTYIPFI